MTRYFLTILSMSNLLQSLWRGWDWPYQARLDSTSPNALQKKSRMLLKIIIAKDTSTA